MPTARFGPGPSLLSQPLPMPCPLSDAQLAEAVPVALKAAIMSAAAMPPMTAVFRYLILLPPRSG
jgi:hypothetical protein